MKSIENKSVLSIKTRIRNHLDFAKDFVNNFINFVNKPPKPILSKLKKLSIKMRI